jgi:hypothetical protein
MTTPVNTVERRRLRSEDAARFVSAATYGTVIALGAVVLATPGDVRSGFGIELVLGAGLATWVAHGFAELVGEQLRQDEQVDRADLRRVALVGSPILGASILQALALLPGRLEWISARAALWIAFAVGIGELVAVGVVVAYARRARPAQMWRFALGIAAVGIVVVAVKLLLDRH